MTTNKLVIADALAIMGFSDSPDALNRRLSSGA
jgi:hypothetical protein